MTEETVSSKLSELFDLYKSGGLTKKEYESLKARLLEGNEVSEMNLDMPPKKQMNRTLVAVSSTIIAVILIIFIFQKVTNSPSLGLSAQASIEELDTQAPEEKTDTQPTTKTDDVNLQRETNMTVWDEAYATSIIMGELEEYSGWSSDFSGESTDLFHQVLSYFNFALNNKEITVGLAFSNYEGNDCNACSGVLSAFEFENRGGWQLSKKSIASISGEGAGGTPQVQIIPLSRDNYGLLVNSGGGTMGEVYTGKDIYTFVNGEFINAFSFSHLGDSETPYSVNLKKYEREGYYYILVEEKEKPEGGSEVVSNTIYAFNGSKYEVFNGAITDPSLTSMNRFYNPNKANQRQNGVCSTCNGTGIQVCNLCGGTGVNNMGIECGCIRTYKMEMAAGHTPSHEPLKWTCTSCRGTGESRY